MNREELIIPWNALESAVRAEKPQFEGFSDLVRMDIYARIAKYFELKDKREIFIPKTVLVKECDKIIDAAEHFIETINSYRDSDDYYISSASGSDERFSVRFISSLVESVAENEADWARLIDKNHEIDPVPPRKRLGIEMFLLGEQEFGLSSKRTTPPDRGAGVPPTGELFPFVTAVLAVVGESVSPTTLEQWSRDAQTEKRRREESRREQGHLRQIIDELAAGQSRSAPAPEVGGTWEQIPDRDWLYLSDLED